MNLDYLFLKSEWAVNLEMGLYYMSKAYAESDLLGKDFVKTKKEEVEKQKKVVVDYVGLGADTFDDAYSIVSSKIDGVAVVQLSGGMMLEDGLCTMGMKTFAEQLRVLDNTPSVRGIIIEVNSGGGEVGAGQLLYSTVKDLKTKVGALVHTAASGAYMGIAPADFIMTVGDLSSVGSIGVLYTVDKKGLEFIKENYKTIYSDLSPQKNIESRELLQGLDDSLKVLLNEVAEGFHTMVMTERMLTYKKRDTLEGGMFSGREAKKRGLVDKIGSYNEAIKLMNKIM